MSQVAERIITDELDPELFPGVKPYPDSPTIGSDLDYQRRQTIMDQHKAMLKKWDVDHNCDTPTREDLNNLKRDVVALCKSVVYHQDFFQCETWDKEIQPRLEKLEAEGVGLGFDIWFMLLSDDCVGTYLERKYGRNSKILAGLLRYGSEGVVLVSYPTFSPARVAVDPKSPLGWSITPIERDEPKRKPAPPPVRRVISGLRGEVDITNLVNPEAVQQHKRNNDPDYRIPDPTLWQRIRYHKHIDWEFFNNRED